MKLSPPDDPTLELVKAHCQQRLDGLTVDVRTLGPMLGVMVRDEANPFPRYLVTGLACDARADPAGFAAGVANELVLFLMKQSRGKCA